MENLFEKKEYIPPQFYSVDGLFEVISALENTNNQVFAEKFPGVLLFATRNEKDVIINDKLMKKLEMSAESAFKKGLFSEEDYDRVIGRIVNLRNKYKV